MDGIHDMLLLCSTSKRSTELILKTVDRVNIVTDIVRSIFKQELLSAGRQGRKRFQSLAREHTCTIYINQQTRPDDT